MNKYQTMAAAVVLMIGVTFGIFGLFKDPIPYAYDNLPDKLNQAMHKNGVHWATISVEGNEVFITGVAPNSGEMVLAKSLVQKEAGVSANFMGVEVKDIKTRNDFETDDEWEEFKRENPPGSSYTDTVVYTNDESAKGSIPSGSTGASISKVSDKSTTRHQQAGEDRYILNFTTVSSECKVQNRLDTENYEIIYKGNTSVIDSRSLSALDWVAEYDETCPLKLKLFRLGKKDETSLNGRKIDEVRYHLMSAGILSERIVTEY